MEWIADPTVWVGLLTLVVLEIVLGIDNLIFIAILADKLPPNGGGNFCRFTLEPREAHFWRAFDD